MRPQEPLVVGVLGVTRENILHFDKYAGLTTEYQVKGEFADYGVRIDRELVAFIEVKRMATKLSTRHLRQVEMYAVNQGVEWIT